MPRWLRVALVVAALLVVGIGGAGWWFFVDTSPPRDVPVYALDIAAIRAKADELPGDKASDVRVEIVATGSQPQILSVAGAGLGNVAIGAFSYQAILPTDTILIDSAFMPGQPPGKSFASYDDDAMARMDAGLGEATEIVVTSELVDHIGGLADFFSKVPDIARGIRMTAEQVGNIDSNLAPEERNAFAALTPIANENYLAIAPGVVLIKAAGASPGSQMVYVKREDGRELLFVGDIAWLMLNIETGTGKPRGVSEQLLHEDRAAVAGELAALKALHAAEPRLLIVPGHDVAAINALIASGAMTAQFKL